MFNRSCKLHSWFETSLTSSFFDIWHNHDRISAARAAREENERKTWENMLSRKNWERIHMKRRKLYGLKRKRLQFNATFPVCLQQWVNFLHNFERKTFTLSPKLLRAYQTMQESIPCNHSALNKNDIDSFDKINILRNSIFWQMQKIFTNFDYSYHMLK